MKLSFSVLIVFGACGLFSCAPESSETTGTSWINIDSLIAAQTPVGATIEKFAALDSGSSSGSVAITENWSEELAAFARIGVINKPIYRNNYTTHRGPDPNSNLELVTLTATDSTAPVRTLKIFYLPDPQQIIRIEAGMKESGLYYSKEEQLSMEFDPQSKRLERYSVTGQQQLAWFSPDRYSIKALVRYADIR